jgi:hypothetical protein
VTNKTLLIGEYVVVEAALVEIAVAPLLVSPAAADVGTFINVDLVPPSSF